MRESAKRMLAWVLSFAMMLSMGVVPVTAETKELESMELLSASSGSEILYSGTDGDLDWSITEDGLLTIEGTGDYETRDWLACSDKITSAVVNVDGITSTASMFFGCTHL